MSGNIIRVRTVSTTHFTGAIAQNAIATETLNNSIVPAALAAGLAVRARLKAIRVTSVQALDWEIWLWNNSLANGGTIDTGRVAGYWGFAASDAKQIAGAGLYYYYIDGLDVATLDLNGTGSMYVSLVNRNAVAKIAGAGGGIVIELEFESTAG